MCMHQRMDVCGCWPWALACAKRSSSFFAFVSCFCFTAHTVGLCADMFALGVRMSVLGQCVALCYISITFITHV